MLQVQQLSKSFPPQAPLFEAVNFSLQRGQYVAVMGESGVGKSTFLNIIAGMEPASSGMVSLDDMQYDTANKSDKAQSAFRRRQLGFVFQAFHVLPYLTVAQNVAIPLQLNNATPTEISTRVAEMLDAVGLSDKRDASPMILSGGQMQRVAIARALVHRPALVLADEPTGNLDPETAAQILALLKSEILRNKACAILVTHSEIAAATTQQIYRLTAKGLIPRLAIKSQDQSF
jgi:putative ABC transport system ATP-binding protein